jgi:hypothetical protein
LRRDITGAYPTVTPEGVAPEPDTVGADHAQPGRIYGVGRRPPYSDRVPQEMSTSDPFGSARELREEPKRWPPSRRTFSLAGIGLVVLALVITGTLVLSGSRRPGVANPRPGSHSPGTSATPGASTGPTQAAGLAVPKVDVKNVKGFYSWALLDRRTGALYGSANMKTTNFSESMVKAWLASDYLRRTAAAGQQPPKTRLDQMTRAIRDSNDGAAESLWNANGRDASIRRLISMCKLQDTTVFRDWWSQTLISARDAVQMGKCIVDGTAAGPQWTPWILNEMRHVRGEGLFGIPKALPADVGATVAIKNGWTLHSNGSWHVNCLGIHDDWILAVMTRYQGKLGLEYGAGICEEVTRQALHLAG